MKLTRADQWEEVPGGMTFEETAEILVAAIDGAIEGGCDDELTELEEAVVEELIWMALESL